MLLHEFRHVDAHHGVFVIEQKLRESLAQLGFSDAGRAEEQERADRAVRILQTRPCAPYRARYRFDGLLLAYHALAKLLLHVKELFALAFQHPVHGNPGPARDDPGNLLCRDLLFEHLALGRRFSQFPFETRDN